MDRLSNLNKLLESEPNDVFLNYALAMEFISLNDAKQAIRKLVWIQSMFPEYLPTYYQLAALYAEENQIDNACDIYKKGMILAVNQNDTKTYSELKSAYEELIF